ncbi:single-stranded DNA-binding protein WHY2, mitochondrial isoform X2 [Phalaenopsis equestris]|uniref:single-stranded DNA-binding protein WHY2, mitochondrial isoform X2 n=1 Tax=Phalaenopsis equestris TaxID=78828 RepID=UPI0009E1DFB8|nr:single-stranded DNA-binding protein WHY2, mitochondrial isoform X2 [Phalaenopsis equestris]
MSWRVLIGYALKNKVRSTDVIFLPVDVCEATSQRQLPLSTNFCTMLRHFFSLRRQAISSRFFTEKLSYVRDVSWAYNLVSERGISTTGSERSSGKAFADFSIFKGKAALLLSPVPPTFIKMDSGHQRVDKKGVILMKFIPAIGQRKYDSERKQYFALSATEVGCLISLGPGESCEFFHDPSMKSSLEGQVKKTLTISPLNDAVMNAVLKTNERLSLPVTKAEFCVMRTACGFVLPLIMGWDRVIGPHVDRADHGSSEQSVVKMDPDLEWER